MEDFQENYHAGGVKYATLIVVYKTGSGDTRHKSLSGFERFEFENSAKHTITGFAAQGMYDGLAYVDPDDFLTTEEIISAYRAAGVVYNDTVNENGVRVIHTNENDAAAFAKMMGVYNKLSEYMANNGAYIVPQEPHVLNKHNLIGFRYVKGAKGDGSDKAALMEFEKRYKCVFGGYPYGDNTIKAIKRLNTPLDGARFNEKGYVIPSHWFVSGTGDGVVIDTTGKDRMLANGLHVKPTDASQIRGMSGAGYQVKGLMASIDIDGLIKDKYRSFVKQMNGLIMSPMTLKGYPVGNDPEVVDLSIGWHEGTSKAVNPKNGLAPLWNGCTVLNNHIAIKYGRVIESPKIMEKLRENVGKLSACSGNMQDLASLMANSHNDSDEPDASVNATLHQIRLGVPYNALRSGRYSTLKALNKHVKNLWKIKTESIDGFAGLYQYTVNDARLTMDKDGTIEVGIPAYAWGLVKKNPEYTAYGYRSPLQSASIFSVRFVKRNDNNCYVTVPPEYSIDSNGDNDGDKISIFVDLKGHTKIGCNHTDAGLRKNIDKEIDALPGREIAQTHATREAITIASQIRIGVCENNNLARCLSGEFSFEQLCYGDTLTNLAIDGIKHDTTMLNWDEVKRPSKNVMGYLYDLNPYRNKSELHYIRMDESHTPFNTDKDYSINPYIHAVVSKLKDLEIPAHVNWSGWSADIQQAINDKIDGYRQNPDMWGPVFGNRNPGKQSAHEHHVVDNQIVLYLENYRSKMANIDAPIYKGDEAIKEMVINHADGLGFRMTKGGQIYHELSLLRMDYYHTFTEDKVRGRILASEYGTKAFKVLLESTLKKYESMSKDIEKVVVTIALSRMSGSNGITHLKDAWLLNHVSQDAMSSVLKEVGIK